MKRIEEYLQLEDPKNYDFSNDGAGTGYQSIVDPIEKYFVYKAKFQTGWVGTNIKKYPEMEYAIKEVQHPEAARKYTEENYLTGKMICKAGLIYPAGQCLSEWVKKRCGRIEDPDNKSPLLQELYKKLWDKNHLKYCLITKKKNKFVKGDTMNSAQTTLNCAMKEFGITTNCAPFEKASIKRFIHFYAIYGNKLVKNAEGVEVVKGLSDFLSKYHTLGNFIPAPFNTERTSQTSDYWDLTLFIIYKWYCAKTKKDKNKELHNLLIENKSVIRKCNGWLHSFDSWNDFVAKNYLQDFVIMNSGNEFGEPKELWDNHFSRQILPEKTEDIEQFFNRASEMICARGARMINELKK